jgi:hypothetical protein
MVDFNGSNIINNPFETLWSTWTNFFDSILPGENNGMVFFLVPIMVLAMGLWVKNPEKPMLPTVFIMGSCALLGSGGLFVGAYGASFIFLILTALCMTALVMNVVWNKGGT